MKSTTRHIQTFEEGVATLEIPQPKTKDIGEYKCVVINEAGEDFCSAKLTVTGNILYLMSDFIYWKSFRFFSGIVIEVSCDLFCAKGFEDGCFMFQYQSHCFDHSF